jgi:hypothetical protein
MKQIEQCFKICHAAYARRLLALLLDGAPDRLRLKPEAARIPKVAVLEAIEKAETGNPVERAGNRKHAHGPQILGETECGKLYLKIVERKRADVGAAEIHGMTGEPATHKAIIFVQDEIDTGD